LVSSASFDDILGQTFAIYIISIAGAESAIGLGILVAFYRLNSSLISTCVHNNNTNSKIVNNFSISGARKSYSTFAKNHQNRNQLITYSIDPWFITGLFDAESSFVVRRIENSKLKTGWGVQIRVQIKMHEKDRNLIQAIKKFFGDIGFISKANAHSTVELALFYTSLT